MKKSEQGEVRRRNEESVVLWLSNVGEPVMSEIVKLGFQLRDEEIRRLREDNERLTAECSKIPWTKQQLTERIAELEKENERLTQAWKEADRERQRLRNAEPLVIPFGADDE